MLIREAMPAIAVSKEVKVRIPIQHHVRLHSMKVLTGKQISDTVAKALDAYFGSQAYRDLLAQAHAAGLDDER